MTSISNVCTFCDHNCKECSGSTIKCTACLNQLYELANNTCVLNSSYCKSNCLPSVGGCKIDYDSYFYNANTSKCDSCNLIGQSRVSATFEYSQCIGKLTNATNNASIGTAYSESASSGLDVCDLSLAGQIPIGMYIVSDVSCVLGNKSIPRVLQLTPIMRFSNDAAYDPVYSTLSIYSNVGTESNIKSVRGLVFSRDVRTLINVGDKIKVTNHLCNIKKCSKYPPPMAGSVSVATTTITNELLINFVNWGGFEAMDTTKFNYSVILAVGSQSIELCANQSLISANGIMCNPNNSLKLGYFGSGGNYKVALRVSYAHDNTMSAYWSDISSLIDVQNITTAIKASDELGKNITATDANSLIAEIEYRKHAMQSINISKVDISNVTTCNDFCKNGGSCSLVNGKPRCACTGSYAGISCDVPKETMASITQQYESASEQLLKMSGNDAGALVNAVEAITSYTDGVSLKTIENSISLLDKALANSSASIDTTTLKGAVTNLFSAISNSFMAIAPPKRKLTDTSSSATDALSKLRNLESVLPGLMRRLNGSLGDFQYKLVSNYFSIMYFSSNSGYQSYNNITVAVNGSSIVVVIPYPYEISKLYQIDDRMSNIVKVLSIDRFNFSLISSSKTVRISLSDLNLTNNIEFEGCAYFDDAINGSHEALTTLNEGSSEIVCNMDTIYTQIYIINKGGLSRVSKILIGVILPLAAVLIVSIMVTRYINKRNRYRDLIRPDPKYNEVEKFTI